jgi:hypothetical protein
VDDLEFGVQINDDRLDGRNGLLKRCDFGDLMAGQGTRLSDLDAVPLVERAADRDPQACLAL